MGLFSFLTGKDDSAASAEKTTGPASAGQASPAATGAPNPPAPSSQADGTAAPAPDTPFMPPPAWNVDALTAPHPVQAGEAVQVGPADPAQTAEFQQRIIDVIKTVYDPEIPVDIYELGLVYEIIVDADRKALIRMTLTSPACPSAQQIPQEVRYKVKAIPGIADAWVEIVWEPPWDKERMSEAAKLTLGFF
ncbi:MAG TPA: iron-sulfur cluster assembly protein [Vicinamibacterales bacterium]|nr:iron-sulfur cluster assembly protein [Vicinamibacterales bacterium]